MARFRCLTLRKTLLLVFFLLTYGWATVTASGALARPWPPLMRSGCRPCEFQQTPRGPPKVKPRRAATDFSSRICSACANIPRLIYTLVCGHTFCKPCYESCVTTSDCVCPLDGDVCASADVTSKEYPAEQLLRRKVHCCNEDNGCRVILPASQVAEHIRHHCKHHVTRCPTCSAAVLSLNMCAHLKSQCTALVLHAATQREQGTNNSENIQLGVFEREVQKRVVELDAKLAQLSLESASQSDKLIDVCQNINHLKDELTHQIETASLQTLDRLDQNKEEMKALMALEKTIQQRVGKLEAKIAQLFLKSDSQIYKLIEISRNNNHLKEALAEQLGPALDRNAAEMKAHYAEKVVSLTTAINSALLLVPRGRKMHQRVVPGYAMMKETALKNAASEWWSDKVCLGRYVMSWGIDFRKDGQTVYIALCMQLHEGIEDDFLDWPFTKELRLGIIHPETRQELHVGGKPNICEDNKKFYSRPIKGSNARVRFPETTVASSAIERGGYVKEDQLLLRLEVLL